jgi:SAM-dependent methyltransferase
VTTTNHERPERSAGTLPPCPITGKPAKRLIQSVKPRLLSDIWRYGQRVDVGYLFEGIDRISLYESPTGLVFFDPPVVGDGRFYGTYYNRKDIRESLTQGAETRVDFATAAGHVKPGDKVVDVGSGPSLFRHHVPQAQYFGLDPYTTVETDAAIIRETLEEHAGKRSGAYDVATAFHVIEHVPDPRRHAELMVQLVRPGGLIIMAAPLHPSPLTEIPNLPLNLPPHHVTWWNPSAFTALAHELGLEVVEARNLASSPHQAPLFWLHRLLLRRTDSTPPERYMSSRLSWHASIWLAYMLSGIARRFKAMPDDIRPIDTILIARKPG